jgi:hypothetical protein
VTQDIDLTGYTKAEIEHMERVEQQGLLHEEICWLADQSKAEGVREVGLAALQRLGWLNQQTAILVKLAAYWEARATGAEAIVEHQVKSRDLILDEYAEYIKSVQDGTHKDVQQLVAQTHDAAFEEFQRNHNRLEVLVEKLRADCHVVD